MKSSQKINIGKSILKGYLGKKIPLSVNIAVTNRCNYRCYYCGIPKRKQKEMTTQEIFSLIDQLKDLGCYRIGLTGGEPLTRKDIGEIINYIKKKRIFSTLVTNGALLKNNINKIKNIGAIALSLHGPKEIHDKQIQTGAYDKLIEGIKVAKENKIRVWNLTVLTKYNIDHIDFILQKSKELDFNVLFQPVFDYSLSGNRNLKDILPDEQKFKSVIKKLIQEKKINKRIMCSKSCFNYLYNWPELKKLKCWAGKLFIYIDVNGDVYPCFGMIGRIKPRNFLEEGLKNAIKKTKILPCNGCWCQSYIELNHLFGLDINSITDMLKKTSNF